MSAKQPKPHRPRLARQIGALGIAAVMAVSVALLGAPGPASASANASPGVVRVIGPTSNQLVNAIHDLHAGDTLELLPGTYSTDYLRMYRGIAGVYGLNDGTAAAPITLTSADPTHPALLYGGLQLWGPRYWHLSYLRVQATVSGRAALYVDGGIGWSVTSSEFWGAAQTGSYANVAIAGTGGEPSRFSFAGNCLYGAATNSTSNSDQNIYVSFAGTPTTSGSIARNIIWGSPRGEAIKLGNGGAVGAPGPWNVTVTNNTLYNNGRQLLLTGDVRNNKIQKNLLVHPTTPFSGDPRTTQIYVNGRIGPGNVVDWNYGFGASLFDYDPDHAVHFSSNAQSNAASYNPDFATVNSCSGFHPTNAKPWKYGRYGLAGI
jgi:hypothetical protein